MLRQNLAHAFAFVLSLVWLAKAEPNVAPANTATTTAAPSPPAQQPAPAEPAAATQPETAPPVQEPAPPAPPRAVPTETAPASLVARPPGEATPSAPEKHRKHGERKRRPGVHEHDGFYGRFGLGFSGFGDTVALESAGGNSFRDYGLVTGFSTVSELAIGGTIKNGFVLGGGLYAASIETPFVFEGNGRPLPSEFRRPDSFGVLGIMGDFYPNPRRGLHLQAAVGVAALTGLNPGGSLLSDRHVAVGGGAMLGIGYDWWVGEQWSIGVLARGTAAAMAEDDAHGVRWLHLAAAWPSILFTVTFH
jgi:hypothetical protein